MDQIEDIVRMAMSHCPAHDIEHVERVYSMALRLSEHEQVDLEVIKKAAWLHDIAGAMEINDPTGHTDHAVEGANMAGQILTDIGFPKLKIVHVQDCILSHRYRTNNKPKTDEAKIIYDADKLDTLGAIGVARSYVWIGSNNAHMFKTAEIEEYSRENLGKNGRIMDKSQHSPQIEWETKYKHLPESLYTPLGRQIARERLSFMKMFLERLEQERKGEL